MPQIFHRATNPLSKASIFGAVFILAGVIYVFNVLYKSSYVNQAQVIREQPVPFSHKHHVKELGIDCRYCHTSVEDSSFAGIPSVKTCMTCHSQIWAQSSVLEPVRESDRTGKPLEWVRVNSLPDYVYFDHSIHVHKGIACETCHGPVDEMPLTWRQSSLHMKWCMDCHKHPVPFIRPRDKVFAMGWKAPDDMKELQRWLAKEYDVKSVKDCVACHR